MVEACDVHGKEEMRIGILVRKS